jgi:Tfp pilus assembly protein PilN
MSRLCLGILVEGEALRLALVSRGMRQAQLVDSLSIECFREKEQVLLQTEVSQFLQRNNATGCHTALVIPRSEIVVRKFDLPGEAENNLAKVVEYQLANLLPTDEAAVCYDYLVAKTGKDAKLIAVTIFLVLKAPLEDKLRLCERTGLKVERIVPSSVLVANCRELLPQLLRKPAMMFAHVTDHQCELASFINGTLHQVQDLQFANDDDLLEALQRETKVFRSLAQLQEEAPLDVFLFSPSHKIWEREAEDRLLKLHPISNLSQLGISRGKTTLDAHPLKDHFLPTLLALVSFRRRSAYPVNLLPPDRRVEKSRWLWAPVYALLGINLVLLLAVGLRKSVQQDLYSSQLKQEVRQLEPEVKKIRLVESEIETFQKRGELLANFRKSTGLSLGALNELSLVLPNHTWVSNFAMKEQIIEIYGASDEASKLPQILDNSPYFKSAEFAAPITRDTSGKEIFRIRMRVEAAPSLALTVAVTPASSTRETK